MSFLQYIKKEHNVTEEEFRNVDFSVQLTLIELYASQKAHDESERINEELRIFKTRVLL